MGHSTTPTHRVEITDNKSKFQLVWNVKGRITDTVLENYISRYAKSLEPGGVNEHLSENGIHYPTSAKVVDQKTGKVKAEWKAGMFHIW